jgi:hypothetical protein
MLPNKHTDLKQFLRRIAWFLPQVVLTQLWLCQSLPAQTASAVTAAALTPFDQQVVVVAQGGSVSVPIVLDPSANGGDTLDIVTSDPSVIVALFTPAHVSINAQSAASFGVNWTTALWATNSFTVPTFLDIPGSHTLVQLPASLSAGTYQVVLNASVATASSSAIINYLSSSAVSAGIVSNPSTVSIGTPVVLSALIFEGSSPVTGASAVVTVFPEIDVSIRRPFLDTRSLAVLPSILRIPRTLIGRTSQIPGPSYSVYWLD